MDSIKLIYLSIFGGAIMLAGGGLLATWGWNRLSSHDQRVNVIRGISREIRFNELYRETQPRLFDPKDDSALAQEGMIPRFRNVATRSALASGLLDRSSSFNEQLVDMLVKYEWTIDYVNKALEWAEQERIKVGGRQVAESIRRNLLESPTYSEYLESERQLKTFLELNLSDYTVSVKKN